MPLTRQQKLSIIKTLADEDELRKDVLIPIYRNMGFLHVIDNHGANEKGKDIVLVNKSEFGAYRYTAVIVKSTPINNATSGSDTASNVIQQLNNTIVNGYSSTIQNQEVRFNEVLIVTSQTISNTAKETFVRQAQSMAGVAVTFQEADDLVELVDKYLPDIYFYRSPIQSQLASALKARCERMTDLQRIPGLSTKERALIDVFIQPQLERLNTKSLGRSKRTEFLVQSPNEVMSASAHILIVGEQGAGKSTILREAVLRQLSLNTRDKEPIIPILAKADEIARVGQITLIDAVNELVVRGYGIPDFDFESLTKISGIAIFIDGLDELVDVQMRSTLMNMVNTFVQRNPNVKVILTSRIIQETLKEEELIGFLKWTIRPFDFIRVRQFIGKWLENLDAQQRLIDALIDHDLLSKLPNTPLVLTLLAILFESENDRELPANLSELYRMFVDLLLGRWSLDRRVDSLYDANIREYIAVELARVLHASRSTAISPNEFRLLIEQCSKTLGRDMDARVLQSDFVEQTALLQMNDKGELEFRHRSFQEFFVATYLAQTDEPEEITYLVQNLTDPWHAQVLYFYVGIKRRNLGVLKAVEAQLLTLVGPYKMQAILQLGYLLQSAYLTPVNERMKIVSTALREYSDAIQSIEILPIKFGGSDLPSGFISFAFLTLLAHFYSSRFLIRSYSDLFDELSHEHIEEVEFPLVALAMFLMFIQDASLLTRVQPLITSPKLVVTLKVISEVFIPELPAEERQKHKKELNKLLKKLNKWIKENQEEVKKLTHATDQPKLIDISTS